MRCRPSIAGIALAAGLVSAGAAAQTPAADAAPALVSGELRLYAFNRLHAAPSAPDASAIAGALLLNAETPTFGGGFSLGASLATANAFGTQPAAGVRLDATLMGRGNALTAIGQAYAQYRARWMTLRLGDQYLDTPWLGRSDSRMVPASYQALAAVLEPAAGWQVLGARTYGWKSRTSDGYHSDNLYYPRGWRGDSLYGGMGGLPEDARPAQGAWVLGVTYASGDSKVQAWYYDFPGFSQLRYIEGTCTLRTGGPFEPFLAAQYVDEAGGSGTNVLIQNRVKLFGVAGQRVAGRAWGIDAGVRMPHGRFDVSWNRLAEERGALGGGAIISPYTAGYTSDPLYTTSMVRSLVQQGPGDAWKARFTGGFLADRLLLQVAYSRYLTKYHGRSADIYLDVTWKLDRWLNGLSVRDRWERSSGGIGLNPGDRPFTYNRVMVVYRF